MSLWCTLFLTKLPFFFFACCSISSISCTLFSNFRLLHWLISWPTCIPRHLMGSVGHLILKRLQPFCLCLLELSHKPSQLFRLSDVPATCPKVSSNCIAFLITLEMLRTRVESYAYFFNYLNNFVFSVSNF